MNIFKDKSSLIISLLIIGIISMIVFMLDCIQFSDEVLFLTFLALIWYASETGKMRKEMAAQNELEQKPIVDLFYRPQTEKNKACLRLKNNGKGVAYNCSVKIIDTDDNKTFEFYFEDSNLIITTGDEQTLKMIALSKNKEGETWHGDSLGYFLEECVTKNTWENIDKKNQLIINNEQKTKLEILYKNGIGKEFKRTFFIYAQITKGDAKKEFEVEFYKEETL
ncbi:MAG: hypothetical protein ABIF17_03225 [Patescibacteria group bacterium]